MSSLNMLIFYIAAGAFWDILRHVLEETNIYFAAFSKLKNIPR